MFNRNSHDKASSAVHQRNVPVRYFAILAIFTTFILPAAGYVASAQQADHPWHEVRSIYTTEYGVTSPKGLAFSPAANAFLLWKEDGSVGAIDMHEDGFDTQGLQIPVEDAHNIAFNEQTNSLFALSGGTTQLDEYPVDEKGLPVPAIGLMQKANVNAFNLNSARGIAFDPATGRMFVLNAQGKQLVIVTPGNASALDATSVIREGRVTRINLKGLGAGELRGVAFNPSNGYLYLSDPASQRLYEVTQTGKKVSEYDLSLLQMASPEAMVFAPSGDPTDDPATMSLFILDSGQQTESASIQSTESLSGDGRLVELALVAPAALPPGTTLLPATLIRTFDTSNQTWNPSSPDPAGVDFWPLLNRLVIADSEVDEMPAYFLGKNVFIATTAGQLSGTCSTTAYTGEPTGVAVNPINNHLFISSDFQDKVFEIALGPDGVYCSADDIITTTSLANLYGITDAEDVAFGNNTLYVGGGDAAEVYVIPLGANGVLGGGDDGPMTQFDTTVWGFNDVEGIGFNWDNGTVFIVSTKRTDKYLGEVQIDSSGMGTLLRAYDLSFMPNIGNIRSDVSHAPGSQNPSIKSIYIVSRGVDNDTDRTENDGKVWEISIGDQPSATSTPTPTLDPNITPTSTGTATNTSTPTSTATATPTATLPPGAAPNPLYISLTGNQTIGGVSSADEDILRFDGNTWSLFFDGSDVGINSIDTFGFTVLDETTLLFSFSSGVTVNGVPYTAQDVVRFDATSLGSTTAGTFSMYLNGSDVGLDSTADRIDAVDVLPDGRILISTRGIPSVPGLSGLADEDILAFTPTTLGSNTTGTWELYFDGSDVGLADTSSEDVDALDVVDGALYLSAVGDFSVNGVSGFDEDVFVCTPTSLGSVTACNFSPALYFDGSAWGLDANDVDAFNFLSIGPPPTATPTSTPSNTPTSTDTPTPTATFTPTFTPTEGPSPTNTATATPTNTATDTPTPSNTPTASNTPLPTNTPTETQTPSPTPVQPDQSLYLSLSGGQTLTGMKVEDVDILNFDGTTWSFFFDASDVGIATSGQDVNDFHIVDSSTLLLTFSDPIILGGLTVDPWDIIQFNATSLGENTAGTFSMYLDGDDVGLDSAEGIMDALALLPDGRVLISTSGNPSVPGVTGAADEDILAFTPITLGDATSGTWELHFDGSDVGLADSGGEDIAGLDVAPNGDIYLSVLTGFSVNGVSGLNEDVFVCSPTSLGSVTACNFLPVLYFDGSSWGLDSNAVDGIQIP